MSQEPFASDKPSLADVAEDPPADPLVEAARRFVAARRAHRVARRRYRRAELEENRWTGTALEDQEKAELREATGYEAAIFDRDHAMEDALEAFRAAGKRAVMVGGHLVVAVVPDLDTVADSPDVIVIPRGRLHRRDG